MVIGLLNWSSSFNVLILATFIFKPVSEKSLHSFLSAEERVAVTQESWAKTHDSMRIKLKRETGKTNTEDH